MTVPLVLDRIKETTVTEGTGAIALLGAAAGFRGFDDFVDGDSVYYTIAAQTPGQWEVGIGTVQAGGTVLDRTTVLSTSDGGVARIDFAAGTKDVFCDRPAAWLTAPIAVASGGIGVGTLTLNGVLYGNGTGAVLTTAQGPANSVLTANAGAPSFSATPTITGLTVTSGATAAFFVSPTTNLIGINTNTPTRQIENLSLTAPATVSSTPATGATDTVYLIGGTGGNTDIATTGVGGIGSAFAMVSGIGGVATGALVSATGGMGGNFTFNSGAGGASGVAGTGTNRGGLGGTVSAISGEGGLANGATSGTNTGGTGGAFSFLGGNGGAATTGSGSLIGGVGGTITIQGGVGGAGATTSGAGGSAVISGGTGGLSGTVGGNGGSAGIQGGAAGNGLGAVGGAATVTGRNGPSGGSGGAGGAVTIQAGNAGGDNTANRAGGTVSITSGAGKGNNAGALLSLLGGAGGIGQGATGATGGGITISPGTGGVGSSVGGAGGVLTLNGGLGADTVTDGAGGAIVFQTAPTITRAEVARFIAGGQFGLGVTTPTAIIHLKAGTATASTAPLKFNSGTLLTTAEAGAIEFLTDDVYATITTGAARKKFVLDDGTNLTSGRVPFATTNGRLTDDADLTFATDTLTATKINTSQVTDSGLTDGRMVFAGAGGLLSDSSQLTYLTGTTTLTAPNIVASSGLTSAVLTSGRVVVAGAGGLLTDDADLTFSGDRLTATKMSMGGPLRLKNYTVATLPAGTQGDVAFVTDALAPAFLTAVVGGGAAVSPVFFDGAAWVGF